MLSNTKAGLTMRGKVVKRTRAKGGRQSARQAIADILSDLYLSRCAMPVVATVHYMDVERAIYVRIQA